MLNSKIRIAFDIMGGDFAPHNELKAAASMKSRFADSIDLILVGKESIIKENLQKSGLSTSDFEILNADDVITMQDDPTEALKTKKESSIYKGLEYHKSGRSDAFVSAGNTGAMLSLSTILLGRIKGVSRPTIGSFFPSKHGKPVLIVDVGATLEPKPRYLYEFAVMGSIYYSQITGTEKPVIGLLNIGEEEIKGTEIVKETYKLLKSSNLNFVGNIEGRDIFDAKADVVICDGFVGNIVLKFAESFLGMLKSTFKNYADRSTFNKLKVGMMLPLLKDVLKDLNYENYGGVPLLGVNGVSIIGHGSSSPTALENMVLTARDMVKAGLNTKIETALTN
ncbi:MAG: phosphate acyltransferase PlsX [Candidatus Kapabacteria bacterium]|nr:phosphate acyltransferase PlsX [Ignavibacteriota bacterium]MCW5885169.1 phosphate acyltransferase PlsX [Candidatus Kapabacteria bacterium]